MVIIRLDVSAELEKALAEMAKEKGISMDRLVSEIVNKYFPVPHTINKEDFANGYKEMGEINLSIANGDFNQKG